MPPVHEEVHPNAEQQWQPDEQSAAQKVYSVLVAKKKAAQDQGDDQINAGARSPERGRPRDVFRLIVMNMGGIRLMCHAEYPFLYLRAAKAQRIEHHGDR